jgi:N-acyl-D-aspartate/D-glutamate deacylase
MEDGCHGMSVGRDYDPGYYATKEEIIELAKETTDYDAVYASHSLRTGLRKARRPGEFPPPKINGILEAIDVGRQSGVSVQISHLGSLYDVYPGGNTIMTEAAAKATLAEVDKAIEEGINVNFDLIPNIRGFGVYSSTWLVASLLPWLRIAGSREHLANALRMHAFREEIKEKIWAGKWYSLNPNINKNWASGSLILECKEEKYINKNIAQIAKEKGKPPLDTLMDVIMTDPYTRVGGRSFSNPSKDLFYQHPAMMAGVDTFAVDTTWEVKTPPWWLPSENSFGGFAAYFRMIVREEKILSIEEAIKHVTSLPAKKFSLTDRGVIKPGAYADIMIMDLEHVTDKATPLEPRVYPEGIPHVFVNGVHVINESNHTGEKPGQVILRE